MNRSMFCTEIVQNICVFPSGVRKYIWWAVLDNREGGHHLFSFHTNKQTLATTQSNNHQKRRGAWTKVKMDGVVVVIARGDLCGWWGTEIVVFFSSFDKYCFCFVLVFTQKTSNCNDPTLESFQKGGCMDECKMDGVVLIQWVVWVLKG